MSLLLSNQLAVSRHAKEKNGVIDTTPGEPDALSTTPLPGLVLLKQKIPNFLIQTKLGKTPNPVTVS